MPLNADNSNFTRPATQESAVESRPRKIISSLVRATRYSSDCMIPPKFTPAYHGIENHPEKAGGATLSFADDLRTAIPLRVLCMPATNVC